jgi:hypothetical protein
MDIKQLYAIELRLREEQSELSYLIEKRNTCLAHLLNLEKDVDEVKMCKKHKDCQLCNMITLDRYMQQQKNKLLNRR